jgi:hypothetical protein
VSDDESRWEGNVVDVQVTQDIVEIVRDVENLVELEVTEVVVEVELLENVVEIAAVGMQGRPGIPGPPGASGDDEVMYDTEVDESVPGVTYVGQAVPGTAKSGSVWRIKKITEAVGGMSVDWADGTAEFDKVWNSRASYTYGP